MQAFVHDFVVHPICALLPTNLSHKVHGWASKHAFDLDKEDLELEWEAGNVLNVKIDDANLPKVICIINSKGDELYRSIGSE